MATKYTDKSEMERKWYAYWQENGFFSSKVNPEKKPYSMIMPPPNVTGVLHMGHVLNLTIQDVLVRRARMLGRETCWVPGTDHASIATEAKVAVLVKQRGLSKEKLGRKGFLEEAWRWKEKYGGIIIKQMKSLGLSCDWEKAKFTMDQDCSLAVLKAFVDLYERGYMYRGKRMIHWDPEGKTALSNEEVIYREVKGCLYYVNYPLVEGSGYVTIATTRPETILGDTALCVHPEDERYKVLQGKKVVVPLIGREISIVADNYVDSTFGTGCLKVTPAHDVNDYVLAQKHNLAIVEIFTKDGKISVAGQRYVGLDRMKARHCIVEDLKKAGYLLKEEAYTHNVGFSERTGAVIEPTLSTQWFVKMKELAEPAIKSVQKGTISFYPSKFVKMYMNWLEQIKDWCISRQLWWGHRIPVYYLPDGRFVVAVTREEALEKARRLVRNNSLQERDLRQDPDVLDTWFSSWLWPLSVFNGTIEPNNKAFAYYYPTEDLVTAPEIIFFWVARMIMAGYAFTGKAPFKNVYFTGIVRDEEGRKMSKSLGNSPDVMSLIEKYGADGVRAGMLFLAPAGNDLCFKEVLSLQGSQLAHKIHHACVLVKSWSPIPALGASQGEKVAMEWFSVRCNKIIREVAFLFSEFRLSEALMTIYRLLWDDFCARYLEMIKPVATKEIAKEVYEQTVVFFEVLLKLLHPFMPFITEEIWHTLAFRAEKSSIATESYPVSKTVPQEEILAQAEHVFSLIAQVRKLKNEHGLKKDASLSFSVGGKLPEWLLLFSQYIERETRSVFWEGDKELLTQGGFVVGGVPFFVSKITGLSREKLLQSLDYQERFLINIDKKLTNPHFLGNVSAVVVDREKKKKADTLARIEALKQLLSLE